MQEGLDNLEDYGLETPLYTLKLTTSDATEYEVYIGNMNAVSGNYYAYTSLEEKVYMIDSTLPDSLLYELYDMVVYDTIPSLSSSNVESVIYKDTDTNLELNMIAEDNGQYDYTDSLSWFVKSGETYEMADSSMVSELFSTIGTFAFAECIDYNAEETEKEVYGLNSTQTSLQISYTDSETEEEGEFVLYIGGNSPDGNYYVGTSLSEAVYIMSADLITPFLEIQTADLMNKSLFLVSSSSVDSIQISSTEGEWEIAISRTEDEEGDVQSSYTLNGNTMDSEKFDEFYSILTGINGEMINSEADSSESYMTVTFNRNSEYLQTVTIKIMSYNDSFYLAEVNGEKGILLNKTDIKKSS